MGRCYEGGQGVFWRGLVGEVLLGSAQGLWGGAVGLWGDVVRRCFGEVSQGCGGVRGSGM